MDPKPNEKKERTPGGLIALGIALGVVFGLGSGIAYGIATDNIATGLLLGIGGVAIGAAIGAGIERQRNKEIKLNKASQSDLQWEDECASCGLDPTRTFPVMTGSFIWRKEYEEVPSIPPVPYCDECFKKIIRYESRNKTITNISLGLAGLIAVAVSLVLVNSGVGFKYALGWGVVGGAIGSIFLSVLIWLPYYLLSTLLDPQSEPVSARSREKEITYLLIPRKDYSAIVSWKNKHILATEGFAEFVKEEVKKFEQIDANNQCWYCHNGQKADGEPLHLVFRKKGEEEKTILVPRCSRCASTQTNKGCGIASLLFILILGLGIAFGILAYPALDYWSWVIGITFALTLIGVDLVFYIKTTRRQEDLTETRNAEIPEVKELIEQGWEQYYASMAEIIRS